MTKLGNFSVLRKRFVLYNAYMVNPKSVLWTNSRIAHYSVCHFIGSGYALGRLVSCPVPT